MTTRKLTPKQARFVSEYLVDLNATQAAIRAGYSEKTADRAGPALLGKTWVAQAIESGKARLSKRTAATADRVIQELAAIAFHDSRRLYRDDGTLKEPHELDDETAAVLAGLEVEQLFEGRGESRTLVGRLHKVKRWDKTKALELLARHFGMLSDQLNVKVAGAVSIYLPSNGRDRG